MRPWRNRRCQELLMLMLWLSCILILLIYITKDESSDIKTHSLQLLWWTDNMQYNYDEVRQCGVISCRVSNIRMRLLNSQGILFYGSNMKPEDFPIPRSRRHVWALLHEESPRNVPYVPYDEFLQHFNYTSTFSRESDMPLTTQYLPQPSDLTQLDYYMPISRKHILEYNDKLAPVAFLQSDCNTMSGREDYVRELMNHIKVDSYGECLHNRDLPAVLQEDYLNNLYSAKLMSFLARYKFILAIENGVCEDYITEKFWRPLMIGVIPIYFGSPSIRDWQPNNKSVIYIEDFPNARALAEFLMNLNDNSTEYLSYVTHKSQRRIDNQMLLKHLVTRHYSHRGDQPNEESSLIHKFECFVCRQLHWNATKQTATKRHYNCPLPPVFAPLEQQALPKYGSDWRSMMAIGRCQAQLLNEFWQANRTYTGKEFVQRLGKLSAKNLCD